MAAPGLLDAWLALVRWFWTAHVDALERQLDRGLERKTSNKAARAKRNNRAARAKRKMRSG
jgi:hypothetical protein